MDMHRPSGVVSSVRMPLRVAVCNSSIVNKRMDAIASSLASQGVSEETMLATQIRLHRDHFLQTLQSLVQQQHGEKLNKMLAEAEEAIRSHPDSPVGYLQAGLAFTDLKMLDSAEAMFKIARCKSPEGFNSKLEEQFIWIRFLQRKRTSEEVLSLECSRLLFEQMILESIFEQPPPVLDLIPDEEKQLLEKKHFEDNQNNPALLKEKPESDSQKLLAKQQLGYCQLRVVGLCSGIDINQVKRVFSRFGRIVELVVKFEDKLVVILTFDNRDSAASAIAKLNGKTIAGVCEDGKSLKLDILSKFKDHLRTNEDKEMLRTRQSEQVNDKKPIENVTNNILNLHSTYQTKPTNIFGLKGVYIRCLRLGSPFTLITIIRKLFSRFGQIVDMRHPENSSHVLVDFSNPDSAVEAIAAFNNRVLEGLSSNQQPVKMRFAPDKQQFHRYHSMGMDNYKRLVSASGICDRWRLKNQCSRFCEMEHPQSDHDIDCQPDRGQLSKLYVSINA